MSYINDLRTAYGIFREEDNLVKREDIMYIFDNLNIKLREDELNMLNSEKITLEQFISVYQKHMDQNITSEEAKELFSTFTTFEDSKINGAELVNRLEENEEFSNNKTDEIFKYFVTDNAYMIDINKI